MLRASPGHRSFGVMQMVVSQRLWRSAGVGIGIGLLASVSAHAAETYGRLTVDIRIDGEQNWSAQQDWGKTKIAERYRVVTHVQWDGELQTVDTLAPDYAEKQIAKGAAIQRRVAEVQQRTGTAPKNVPKTPEEQQALMQRMQTEQLACNNDPQCLMNLAMRYAPVMNAMAMQAMPQPETGAPEIDLDAEEVPRYAHYYGYEGCPTTIEMHVDYRAEGAWADVGGMVPWKETYSAHDRGNDLQRKMQCLGQQMSFDRQTNSFHSLGFSLPLPRGSRVYWDRLHGEERGDGEVPTTGEALAWASEQMRAAPASGSRRTTLKPDRPRGGTVTTGARHDGEIRVQIDWRFEPDVQPR